MFPTTTELTTAAGIVDASTLLGRVPLQFGGGLLSLAILFFVLAIVAAVFGSRGIAGMSMEIAKVLVIVFLILAIVSLIL